MLPGMCFSLIFPDWLLLVYTNTITFKHVCTIGRSIVGRAPSRVRRDHRTNGSVDPASPALPSAASCSLLELEHSLLIWRIETVTDAPYQGLGVWVELVPARHSAEAWQPGHTQLVPESLQRLLSVLWKRFTPVEEIFSRFVFLYHPTLSLPPFAFPVEQNWVGQHLKRWVVIMWLACRPLVCTFHVL